LINDITFSIGMKTSFLLYKLAQQYKRVYIQNLVHYGSPAYCQNKMATKSTISTLTSLIDYFPIKKATSLMPTASPHPASPHYLATTNSSTDPYIPDSHYHTVSDPT